jgi:hypothetical protein
MGKLINLLNYKIKINRNKLLWRADIGRQVYSYFRFGTPKHWNVITEQELRDILNEADHDQS